VGNEYLRYTVSGHLFISPDDDCHAIVDAILDTGYDEEFCVAADFSPEFIAGLMKAGFLVMSANFAEDGEEEDYILLPKLHLARSALFFENLHVKKSLRRLLSRYELRPDADFDIIVDRCVEKHGGGWLTPPLAESIKKIRYSSIQPADRLIPASSVHPASFALYRDGKLAAGEFGVVCGRVYTSYSGFYNEDNAGTVQIVLAARYLQENGFSFFDLGMPLDYKTDLGAVDISPERFVRLFRGYA
jgi:Leu/Phe-tRNA-protein transferase